MRRKHRSAITLLEVFVVIALLGVTVSALQLGIYRMIKEEAFFQEVKSVKGSISFVEEMMMTTGAELTLTLRKEEEGLKLSLTSDRELPDKLMAPIVKLQFKEITSLYFDDKKTKELILHFEGTLGRTSVGVITLENAKGKKKEITLHGFPGRR